MRIREFARHSVTVTEPSIVNAYMKEREFLCSLDTDKLLAGFRETAGIPKRADKYSGAWENEDYCGHTLGHYMVALAKVYAKEKSDEIGERLEYILSELSLCQKDNGYLFAYGEDVFDKLENGQPFKSWYTMHKIISGLIYAYKLARMEQALTIVKKLGEWIVARVLNWTDKEQRRALSVADGGMNDCLYELYKITGDERYAEAAEKFDEPDLFTNLSMGKDVLPNKQAADTIPKVLGALNRYMAFGESEVRSFETAKIFFDMVMAGHTYVTGGNGELLHFRTPGEFAENRTRYNSETCSTYGMMKLARSLYSVTGDKKYMDYYERAYFNAMLGAQNPENGMTAFFQPMATGYFKTFSDSISNFWCCTGTGMEFFTDLSHGIYHASGGGIYVNLYISSVLEDKALGVKLTQTVDPESYASAEFVLEKQDLKETSLYFRVPEWCGEDVEVSVNGIEEKAFVKNGYLSTENKRKSGDRIVLKFYPKVMINKLPDMENCAALSYGPFVLAAGLGTGDMTTEYMKHTDITVATKNVPVHERIMLREGVKLSDWFENCSENIVKKDGELLFTLKGTDADDVLTFRPYYKIYNERYGIYFEYFDEESLTDDLRTVMEEQKRQDEEHKVPEVEAVGLAAEAEAEQKRKEAERQRLEEEAEAERKRKEAERQRLEEEAEAEQKRKEAERQRLEEEAEAERKRKEAERQRLEEEAEAERKRLEAEEDETRRIENEARRAVAQSVAEAERAAELAEAKRREEEENLQAAKLAAERAEVEAAARKAEAEHAAEVAEAEARQAAAQAVADAERAAELAEAEARQAAAQAVAEAERAAELAEAEARQAAAQAVAEAERAAELAEAKRKEEEENLQAAKLAAERAEAEEAAQKAEAEAARLRHEAEAEEEQRRIEAEAKQIAAQKVADAERAAEVAEAEARQAAARNVADAERAAELAEAKRKEEEEKLQAAKLAEERAEVEAKAQKAEAEAEEAKTRKAEEALKQEKTQMEADRVQKASEKAADKEKKKALKKRQKKQRRAYRDYSALKVILWVVGVLAFVVVLYLFATPISKGFLKGKNALDTFVADKLPQVAKVLKVRGHGYDMPVFKEDAVYLKEDAEHYVQTTVWPRAHSASVVRIDDKQYICVEGNGLKMYYLNEVSETENKHVYLEKGDAKALYFKDYSFDDPASLCPISGVFNADGVEQYIFLETEISEMQILDANTLKECVITLDAEDMGETLQLVECQEDGQNVLVHMTSEEIPYTFWVLKKGGLSLTDGYGFALDGVRYEIGNKQLGFKAYVTSAGLYLGEVSGILDFVAGNYVPSEVKFYAFADDDFVNKIAPAITATHYKEAEMERVEITGENGERLLVLPEVVKKE